MKEVHSNNTTLPDGLTLFTCGHRKDLSGWQVVNDGVMGGESKGFLSIDNQGNCEFYGEISLENNGGFSMVRYRIGSLASLAGYRQFRLRVRGDGRQYQFRVKSILDQRHSYGFYFETTGEWQQVTVSFEKLLPIFRGNQLDLPVYQGKNLQEVAFLTGKNAGPFRLKINELKIL